MLNESVRGKFIPGSLWMLVISLGSLSAVGQLPLEKNLETQPNPRISLDNVRGRIVVKGWDKFQVHAVCAPSSPGIEIDMEQLPLNGPAEKVRFRTYFLAAPLSDANKTADYTLQVPVGSSLLIRNHEGSVRIQHLQGAVSVESAGGTIAVSEVAGHLSVSSVAGDVEVIRSSGRVEASSLSGRLRLISPSSSQVSGTTTSGDITYQGDFARGGHYKLSSYSGDIQVVCPTSASFELRAKTVQGRVIPDPGLSLTVRRNSISPSYSGNSLFSTHNTGSATVELTSFTGTIRIRRAP